VGKTTCAAASALYASLHGFKTLVISTDATPSLAHIFDSTQHAGQVSVGQNLYFQEIGIEEARQMWDAKFGKDVYQVFSSFVDLNYSDFSSFIASILPGLAEEFMVDYIRELSDQKIYDIFIWDTAPLGQTLALLKTPAMLVEHLRMAPRIYSRLKIGASTGESLLKIIKRWEILSRNDIEFLQQNVEFNIVTIAEALAVNQLDSIFTELKEYNFKVDNLIINNLIRDRNSPFLEERAEQQKKYVKLLKKRYACINITELPMLAHEIKGLERLDEMATFLFSG
jgi:arsenite-transporting ATPase